MTKEPPAYRSYLLRLWRVEHEGQSVWRASLESAQTGERHAFADLASLCAFLSEQTAGDSDSGKSAPAHTP
ncbi:MAG TPA: hypothetical protein VKE41_11860 [Roseiflexaceae bacterium]|nr:hypothetical protein [Roseiflexaceae bacterium]